MSDYTYTNNTFTFGQRDGLAPGSAEKVVKGIQLDFEFLALVTAVNSKLDKNGTDFEGVIGSENAEVNGGTF